MTLQKGYAKINIKKSTQARLNHIRKLMEAREPEKYDETASYNTIVTWLVDYVTSHIQKERN